MSHLTLSHPDDCITIATMLEWEAPESATYTLDAYTVVTAAPQDLLTAIASAVASMRGR